MSSATDRFQQESGFIPKSILNNIGMSDNTLLVNSSWIQTYDVFFLLEHKEYLSKDRFVALGKLI